MSLTYAEAVDDINTMFKTASDSLGYTVHWDNVKTDRDKGQDPYIVFLVRHASGRQESLGGIGNRSFDRRGIALAELHFPTGKGLSESYNAAKTVADAYEGKSSPNGVWFRNVRIQEIGREGEFFQINVVIEFTYNEVK